jgi:hypothetical protein
MRSKKGNTGILYPCPKIPLARLRNEKITLDAPCEGTGRKGLSLVIEAVSYAAIPTRS